MTSKCCRIEFRRKIFNFCRSNCRQCRLLEFNLHCMQTDPQFTFYSYVTWDDLIECFGSDLVLTVRNYDLYKSSSIKVSGWSLCFHFPSIHQTKLLPIPAPQVPQYEGNLQIQSDCRSIEVKLVLNEPTQPFGDPLTENARAAESSLESDDGSDGSKMQSRKRKSTRNANNNDKERPTNTRDESPDTKERNELAKILFSKSEKKFRRNLDQPLYDSNECKLKCCSVGFDCWVGV